MKTRAFVLLSGGLDSTTMLYHARRDFNNVEAVSVNYGQRHKKELLYAERTAQRLDHDWHEINLRGILDGAMLTDPSIKIPEVRYSDIDGVSPTYVPFRNGLLLSLISARAQQWINEDPNERNAVVYFGAHAEDAQNWAYPDCTPEFIGAMANAIYIGTYHKVRLHTPLMWLMKYEIVKLGSELGVDFGATWSCYAGGDLHCGACPTCFARHEAFRIAGIPDPTKYAVPIPF